MCSRLSCFSCVWFIAIPWTVAHQAPLSMRILQARILEWVVKPFSRGSSQPWDQTQVSFIPGGFFIIWATREVQENCISMRKIIILNSYSTSKFKIKSKLINVLNVRCESTKFLGENIWETINDIIIDNSVLHETKTQVTRAKTDKWDNIKIKSFCPAKETISKINKKLMT